MTQFRLEKTTPTEKCTTVWNCGLLDWVLWITDNSGTVKSGRKIKVRFTENYSEQEQLKTAYIRQGEYGIWSPYPDPDDT